jgi:MFS transporter, MHS family, shikimate and dehydroshikimate transport protein
VASGFTPLIAAWLVTRGDGSLWLVAGYNVAVAALSLVCARLLPEIRGRDLDEPWVDALAGDAARGSLLLAGRS